MRKNLRLIIGIIVLVAGGVFMIIPFIPLGYILLFIGAFLLAPKVPFLRKFMNWLKKKDKSGKLEKAEDKVDDILEKKDEDKNDNKKSNIYRISDKRIRKV